MIRELPLSTIEQIAAGEIILRPESVVKEAVENSLDAQSTSISVEIEQGGKSRIRVTDDGHGMSSDDLQLAFFNHCTSKLINLDELFSLDSCGFRGEALNAIGNVSNASLLSAEKDAPLGHIVRYHFGQYIGCEEAVTNPGTTLIVEDLFSLMPVRKKFLASDKAEEYRIRALLERFAIGYSDVRFSLMANGHDVLTTTGSGKLLQVIYELYGYDTALKMIEVEGGSADIAISGAIGHPSLHRSNPSRMMFYVNGRMVENEKLRKCVLDAYRSVLPSGKFPMAFLFLTVPAYEVDVNVHPAKKIVGFAQEERVLECLNTVIQDGILTIGHQVYPVPQLPNTATPDFIVWEEEEEQQGIQIAEPPCAYHTQGEATVTSSVSYVSPQNTIPINPLTSHEMPSFEKIQLFQDDAIICPPRDEERLPEKISDLFPEEFRWKYVKILGILFGKFLLVEHVPKGIFVVIHLEKVLFRVLYARMENNQPDSVVAAQALLEPYFFRLDPEEMRVLDIVESNLISMGFQLDHLKDDQIVIRAIPASISDIFRKEMFYDLMGNVLTSKRDPQLLKESLKRSIAVTIAKDRKLWTLEEGKTLLDELFALDEELFSPYGEEFIVTMNKYVFEKVMFP